MSEYWRICLYEKDPVFYLYSLLMPTGGTIKSIWAKHNKEELVKRTMQISDRLADVIGLDKSYPKCKKHLEKQQEAQNDVGGEALTLVTTRGAR